MFTTAQILEAKNGADRKAMIAANIEKGPWEWVVRGLEAIYERQTADEKEAEATSHHNGVGFNGIDAAILSSFAKQVKAWKAKPEGARYPRPLSEKQLALARKKMKKYAGQLARIAEERAKSAQAPIPVPTQPEPEFQIITVDRQDIPEPEGIIYTDRNGERWYCENFADYLYAQNRDFEEANPEYIEGWLDSFMANQKPVVAINWEQEWLEQVQARLERVRPKQRHPRANRHWK